MSEFYLVRRNSIADLAAFFGFLVGFLGSAPIAWPFLQVGFQTGEITKGFAYFLSIIVGAGVVCGAIGLGLGRVGGWLWERGHRYLRTRRGGELPLTRGRRDEARVARDRAIVAALHSDALAEVVGIRFDTATPEPVAYATLLERAGLAADDEVTLERALRRTTNTAAWHGHRLVGIARVLSDGHRYAALAELVVDPEFRRRGIGKALVRRVAAGVQTPLSAMASTERCQSLISAATGGREARPTSVTRAHLNDEGPSTATSP
jgi:GNAT superfamily N-acetyltransferase